MTRALLLAARELRAERAQPDGLVAAVTFTALLVLLESLTIGPLVARQPGVAAALFWIAVSFAAILGATRSFDREMDDDAIDAIVALPGGRDAIYAGKVAALGAILAVVGAAGGALSLVLLDLDVALPLHLAFAVAVGVLALPPVVVLVVLLALRLRGRGVLVPVLALPMLLPELVSASQASSLALSGDGTGALAWSGLLVASGLVFAVLGLTLAPTAID